MRAASWLMTFPEDKASLPFYTAFAESFGVQAQAVTSQEGAPASLDEFGGLLLSGGGDVDPSRYGDAAKHDKTYGVNAARDEMELGLIARFIAAEKPVVGICRGLQILTVYFGGRLHQHVPDVVAAEVENHRVPKGYDCFHPLLCDGATRLGAALRGVNETNSAHHQAMNVGVLPRTLRVAATSPRGIVEAVESFEVAAPILAVQWHPERLPVGHPARERLAEFIRWAVMEDQQQQQQQ